MDVERPNWGTPEATGATVEVDAEVAGTGPCAGTEAEAAAAEDAEEEADAEAEADADGDAE